MNNLIQSFKNRSYLLLLLFLCSNAFGLGTADWMEEIYSDKPNTRLVDIAIPGTHNSATYAISYLSKVSQGENFLFNFIKPIVAGWSKTQFKSVHEQLIHGIRFLDLRITFNKKRTPYIVHGLVAMPLKRLLNEVSRFVDDHPKEIVLLAFQLDYNYKVNKVPADQREDLLQNVYQITREHFRDQLLPFSSNCTLADFWQGKRSVMILEDFEDYWPQAYNSSSVRAYLDRSIRDKSPNKFSNLQLIFTPPQSVGVFLNPQYAFPPFPNENSLSVFSMEIRKNGASWIKSWRDAGFRPNIVTTDFFDRFSFVQTVLDLNLRL